MSPASPPPTGAWVTQQARNLLKDLDHQADRLRYLIRDRDTKVSAAFDTVLTAASIQITWAGPDGDELTSSVDAYLLCMCIAKGVLSWLRDVDDDPAVARRLSGMIRVESTGATARRLRQERQTR